MNENILAELDKVSAAGGAHAEPWRTIFASVPNRIDWQRYDHCAAITRLYALFEVFVDEAIKHYLGLLAQIVGRYGDLAESVRVQHRVGVGQILQKWSDVNKFRNLTEKQIVEGLTSGLSNSTPYALLADAFLLETSNYRLETIGKIFAGIGVANCMGAIETNTAMKAFMTQNRGLNETAAILLKYIVESRNEAAHATPATLIGLTDFESLSEFVVLLAEALAAELKSSLLPILKNSGFLEQVATVTHNWGSPKGIALLPCTLAKRDLLISSRGTDLRFGYVESIEFNNVPHDAVTIATTEQYGIKFSSPLEIGDLLMRSKIAID